MPIKSHYLYPKEKVIVNMPRRTLTDVLPIESPYSYDIDDIAGSCLYMSCTGSEHEYSELLLGLGELCNRHNSESTVHSKFTSVIQCEHRMEFVVLVYCDDAKVQEFINFLNTANTQIVLLQSFNNDIKAMFEGITPNLRLDTKRMNGIVRFTVSEEVDRDLLIFYKDRYNFLTRVNDNVVVIRKVSDHQHINKFMNHLKLMGNKINNVSITAEASKFYSLLELFNEHQTETTLCTSNDQ